MRTNCVIWAAWRYVRLQAAWLRAGSPAGMAPHVYFRSSYLAPWWVPSFGVEHWDAERGCWVLEKVVPDDPAPLRWWQTWRKFLFASHIEVTYRHDGARPTA